jgi:hypothetical protein
VYPSVLSDLKIGSMRFKSLNNKMYDLKVDT